MAVFHVKCIARCGICLFWILWQGAQRVLLQKMNWHCEEVSRAYTLFSVGFGSGDGVQGSNIDKKQAATRHSAPCGKLKCQTRKNLCIAYTQVNTHAHFFSPALCVFFFFSMKVFHTETHISRAAASPPTWRRVKFILLTPDKPTPALSGTGSRMIKKSWRNQSYSPLSWKKNKVNRRATHSDLSRHTQIRTKKMHPWVHVDKFFNKLWLKGSWFYSDSPPSFQTVYWK